MSARPQGSAALKRRVAPSVRFKLRTRDDDEQEVEQDFLLCFDANALAALEEKIPGLNTLNLGGLEIFGKMNARLLGAALWAAVLRHHPEYDTIDGLGVPSSDGIEAIRSFVDLGNAQEVVKALEEAYLKTLPKSRADEIRKLASGENLNPTSAAAIAAEAEMNSTGSPSGASQDYTDSPISKSAD